MTLPNDPVRRIADADKAREGVFVCPECGTKHAAMVSPGDIYILLLCSCGTAMYIADARYFESGDERFTLPAAINAGRAAVQKGRAINVATH